jgi:hypothetical protein
LFGVDGGTRHAGAAFLRDTMQTLVNLAQLRDFFFA